MKFENGKLKVRLTLLEQCLGTKPGNDELLRDYIVSKSGDEAKMAEKMKAWREANRDHRLEYQKEYSRRNREKVRASQRAYYERNRLRIREARYFGVPLARIDQEGRLID